MRWIQTATLVGWTALASCTCGGPPRPLDAGLPQPSCDAGTIAEIEANCRCQDSIDCTAGNDATWACTPANSCIQICWPDAGIECTAPDVCENLICRPPACGADSECPTDQQCVDGSCQAPIAASSVANCTVLPPKAVINANGAAVFALLVQDAQGQNLGYEGPVSWNASNSALALTFPTTTTTVTVTGSSSVQAGTNAIGASIGSVQCTSASVTAYAAGPSGAVRVVVISDGASATLDDRSPIAGATVVVDDNAPATTDVTGTALFPGLAGSPHTVSAFVPGYAYVTIVQTAANDILLPLKASANTATIFGVVTSTDFNNVGNPEGTFHVGFYGASVGGNLSDISPTQLLGSDDVPLVISLGTATSYGPVAAPEGYTLGLGPSMFGGDLSDGGIPNGTFTTHPEPGYRTFWSLQENVVIGDILQAIGPTLDASTEPFFPVCAAIQLQDLGAGNSALTPTQTVTAGETHSLNTDAGSPFPAPGTLLRLNTLGKLAPLPPAIDCMMVMGGVEAYPQGFIPLGATMGLDETGPDGAGVPDGLIDSETSLDPEATDTLESELELNLAPRHGGFETAPWVFLSLAVPSSNIFPTEDVLVIAGKIDFQPATPLWNGGGVTPLDLSRPFLAPAEGIVIDQSTRTLTVPQVVGATYHRLDIGPDSARWSVYFPANVTSVSIPSVPADILDRFPGRIPQSASAGVLHSFSLGYPPPGSTVLETYDGVWQFDGVDANDLSLETDSFAAIWVPTP